MISIIYVVRTQGENHMSITEKIATAKRLEEMGLSIEQIAKESGLSIKEVQKILDNITK